MTSTIMFLSRRYMKENERLRQELCRTHETNAKQITEKELIINELREQLNLIQSKPKFPPLMSPTSTIDLSSSTEGEYSLETGDLVHGSLLSIPSLPLQITEEEEEGLSDKLPTISRSISKITTSSIVRKLSKKKKQPLQKTEEEEEVLSDKLPTISRSLSKITTSSIVRKLSKKKKHFFRKKARRRGTPLPTTHEQVEVDGEDGEKEQHMNHETTTTTTTSSGWSSEPLLPMSPIRSRPRRATIASGTSRVHQLPREQSLSNLSDDDDDTTATEGDESPVLSNTMQVQNRKVLDALEREGLFTGTIDRKTELPDAYGSMSYSDGSHYKGFFEQGNWHGKATFRNREGDVYHGYFVNNKKEGTGILKWAGTDGPFEKFEGRFQDDKMREGTMLYANTGSFYEGLFSGCHRHGFGKHNSSDGYEFEGQWFKDKMQGHGKVSMPCGGWYNGDFKSGIAHGYGMEVSANGVVQHEGRWDSGYPVVFQF